MINDYENIGGKEFGVDSSSDSELYNMEESDHIASSTSTMLTTVLPEMQKLFKQRNKPLVQYALSEFKAIFGTVGEEVLDKNLLHNEHDLMEEQSEQLLHRKIFYDETNDQVIVISVYVTKEQKFKIVLREPSTEKVCNLLCKKTEILTKSDLEGLDFSNYEALKPLAVSIIEERIIFNKSETEGYKMQVLSMDLLEAKQQDKESSDDNKTQQDPSPKSKPNSEKENNDGKELKRVNTITEEVDSSHSQ